jgi:hypothetical protein
MFSCRWFVVAILSVVMLGLCRPAAAGDLFGLRKRAQQAAPAAPYNPVPVTVAAPPGPYRYPAYSNGNYPWYGYGFGAPTYGWGYFGATYRPAVIGHHGYYDDYTQWGYRQGY